ncbi:FAD/NAD-P-binding domain-containing protein [Mycena rosella]|uniref:FAD/NAD-P-binding domain-containing protein n=1 Tax=Mycena rosella TaxID=1033263 RepID=A0AAD7G968_MYCRO|nr:FAD/NAD-P-binding domain-containing protein [Mycena rosella]
MNASTRLLILVTAALSVAAQQTPFAAPNQNGSPQWTVFHHPIKRVAVIGAGPAGLQAAAKLVEHNFSVRLFDRAPSPGGNWFYTDETPVREPYPDRPIDQGADVPGELPATRYYKEQEEGVSLEDRWKEHWQPRPVWDNLHTNSPKVITELPDVPYSADKPWVLSNHDIQRHVRAYASFHNLNANDYPTSSSAQPVTSYSTRVEKLEKLNDTQTWRLTLRKLERLPETGQIKAQWWTEEFDAIVAATGPYASPHVPNIAGIVDWSKVKDAGQYSVYHSQSYRRPERFQNKTILIVGASVSASEIARDIDPYAHRIIASIRPHDNLHPFQLRSLKRFPDTTEFVPEIAHFEPLAAHDRGIKDGVIRLINGTELHGIDEVIFATGYIRSNVFSMPDSGNTSTSDGEPENLHWTGHNISDPTLAYTNVRPWTIGKYQSYAFAKIWEGTAHLPTQKQMQEDYDNGKYRFRGLFGTKQSEGESLFRQYVAWLNNESLENGGRFVETWPIQNREVFVYYSNLEWVEGYSTLGNFTEFETLPASEWPSGKRDAAAWDAIVYDDQAW